MSVEGKFHSETDAERLFDGAIIQAESIHGGGRIRLEVVEYTGTNSDGTVQLYAIHRGATSLFTIEPGFRPLGSTEAAPYRGGPKHGR